jgi:hypothetical protein
MAENASGLCARTVVVISELANFTCTIVLLLAGIAMTSLTKASTLIRKSGAQIYTDGISWPQKYLL